MKLSHYLSVLCITAALSCALPAAAHRPDSTATAATSHLTVGGYGEAVYSHHFHSNNVFRYSRAAQYKDDPGFGRFDLPHAVFMLAYDFGRGWSFGSEVEFEHGGIEAAIERETDEAAEVEQEIERGGEVALEQFWVQKSFSPAFNIRAGHIVVPVGMTNNSHTPNTFFTVFRPEGENTIFPCTWHETGLSLWGRAGSWRYELQLLPSLNSTLFNDAGWIHNGSASPYEFRPGSRLAGAARIDWNGVPGLRLGLSGFLGNSFNNDFINSNYRPGARYSTLRGTVAIAAFDLSFRNRWLTIRANADYGALSDADSISRFNKNQTTMTGNPYSHTEVGAAAWAAGIEAGVDVLALASHGRSLRRLVLFAHYEHYDSYIPFSGMVDKLWCERQLAAAGLNYFPVPEVALKAEAGVRLLDSQYNNEPYIAVGITWTGYFKH